VKIKLKKYQKTDFKEFDHCMIRLQDFLVKIDPLARLRRTPDFSPQYAKNVLDKIAEYNGVIFLAYDGGKIAGCIAGIMEKQSKKNLSECVPTKAGRIVELFVADTYRSQGIGKILMSKMEDYMRKKKCDVIRVEVFKPNEAAHNFYKKMDYNDRVIDMIKLLK
jgi:ribosomal protein S18 acetylase RimI-like enzyme